MFLYPTPVTAVKGWCGLEKQRKFLGRRRQPYIVFSFNFLFVTMYICKYQSIDQSINSLLKCTVPIGIYYYIILLYLSAHVQRTKQALGIAPHEALFKKKNTRKFTETLQKNCWPSHKSLLPHLSDRHPHSSFLACAIQDHCQLLIIICCFKFPPSLGALDSFYQFFSLILPSCTL